MDDNTRDLVEKYLEPVCLTMLAMNQREFVEPYLKLIGQVKDDPYYALHHSIMNYIRQVHANTNEKLYEEIEQLEELPYNENYDPKFYREIAAFKREATE